MPFIKRKENSHLLCFLNAVILGQSQVKFFPHPIPAFQFCWRTVGDILYFLCQDSVQERAVSWVSNSYLHHRFPLWCWTSYLLAPVLLDGSFLPFSYSVSSSSSFQIFQAHSPCSAWVLGWCPFTDILPFADVSVIACRKNVLLGEVFKGFFTDDWGSLRDFLISQDIFCCALPSSVYFPFTVLMTWNNIFSLLLFLSKGCGETLCIK